MGVQLQLANDLDSGYLRLAAACAMLRLARGHDPRIQSETYFSLALTLQVDSYTVPLPVPPVGAVFVPPAELGLYMSAMPACLRFNAVAHCENS